MYQKRLKKERRARKRVQEQLDLEIKRRTQLEEALKATGASSEQVRAITGKRRDGAGGLDFRGAARVPALRLSRARSRRSWTETDTSSRRALASSSPRRSSAPRASGLPVISE